jgi:hypothetical protein
MLCGTFSVNLCVKILVNHRDTQRLAQCYTEINTVYQSISDSKTY